MKSSNSVLARAVIVFLFLATAPVVALCAWAAAKGGLKAAPWVPLAAMWCPALAAFAVQKWMMHGPIRGKSGLWLAWPNWNQLLQGMLWMGILTLTAFGLTLVLWPEVFAGLTHAHQHVSLPGSLGPWPKLLLALAITWWIAPPLNLPLMLGEELGWRGFLTPRLVTLMGRRGLIAAGAAWGLWHAPAIVLLGYNYPQTPLVGCALFTVICIELSMLMVLAMQRSGSVLAPALMHGVLNQLSALFVVALFIDAHWMDWLHAPTGLVMAAVLALPAWWAYRSIDVSNISATHSY